MNQHGRPSIFYITRSLLKLYHLAKPSEISPLYPLIGIVLLGEQADGFPARKQHTQKAMLLTPLQYQGLGFLSQAIRIALAGEIL